MKKIVTAFAVPVLESKLYDVEQMNDNLNLLINDLFLNMDDKRLLSHEWNNKVLTDNPAATGYSSFDNNSLTNNDKFIDFFQTISPIITDFFSQLEFSQSWNFENSWANVYPQGAFVPAHNHGTSHWSGVYYVKANNNCGDLIFTDPKEYALNNEPENIKWRGRIDMRVHVEAGTLLLFPGYLKHQTMPNQSGADRIVISFNINCHE
jgi:uncharacterized protein (TIGR02466 family)